METSVPEKIDRYKILSKLGEGGMAIVYKALDTRLEREVAIKVIRMEVFPPALLDQLFKRFEREATALARMQHPHIVSVFDFGEYENSPFLVMEYLPGGSLRERTGEPIPYQQAAWFLRPVAEALAYAHNRGVVHRDVKPVNILFTVDGIPKLSDFGIVRLLGVEETTSLTGTGMGIGTPAYMPPEQWRGETSPAVDIYAMGVVFYEMLTGSVPYKALTPPDLYLKLVTESLPDPRRVVPGLPDEVIGILRWCLQPEPENRYPEMADFAEALGRLVGGRHNWERTVPQTPAKAPLVDSGPTAKTPTPPSAQRGSEQNLVAPSSLSVDRAYDNADTEIQSRGLYGPLSPPSKERSFASKWVAGLVAILALGLVAIGLVWNDQQQGVLKTETSSANTALLLGTQSIQAPTEAAILSPTSGPRNTPVQLATIAPTETPTLTTTTVPDNYRAGRMAFIQRNGDVSSLTLLTLASDQQTILVQDSSSMSLLGLAFSPDGRRLAYYNLVGSGKLFVIEASSNAKPVELAACTSPTWYSGGENIICRRSGGAFGVFDSYSGSLQYQLSDELRGAIPSVSPDGRYLAFAVLGSSDAIIYISQVENGNPVVLAGEGPENYAPAWSPDSEWIAYQSTYASVLSEIWIIRPDGTDRRRLTFTPEGSWSRAPVWSPDGQWIAFVSNQAGGQGDYGDVFVVNVASGTVYQITFTEGKIYNWRVAWGK